MAEVRLTMEEYQALLRLQSSERESEGTRLASRRSRAPSRKRKGKAAPGMSRAMKKANEKARKKDGSFRKGWDQARLMSYAHKVRRK